MNVRFIATSLDPLIRRGTITASTFIGTASTFIGTARVKSDHRKCTPRVARGVYDTRFAVTITGAIL